MVASSSSPPPPALSSTLLPPKSYAHVAIVSIGDSCVGKSCLIKRYCEKKFVSKYISTIGIDFGVRPFALPVPLPAPLPPARASTSNAPPEPFTLKLNFFDLSGSPHYRSIRAAFLGDAQLLLACFDVNVRASFEHLPGWLKEAEECRAGRGDIAPPVVCICACMSGEEGCAEDEGDEGGMSSRRRRQVTEAEGRSWAERRGFLYSEVSAKTGARVEETFEAALASLARHLRLAP